MRKKVLYIHHAGEMGGAPRSLAFLINQLDFSKYEPIIWMMRDGEARELFESTGAKVIYNTSKWIQAFHGTTVSGMSKGTFVRNIVGYFPTYFLAKKLIQEIKPDIIHLSTTCLFHFAKAAKKVDKNIKVVCHIREPLLPNFFGNILLNQNIKYVDEFVAISNYDAEPFKAKNISVKVVHNFVNTDDYKFNPQTRKEYRNKLGVADDTFVVSYFARIVSCNGVSELLQIADLLKHNPEIKFYLFGYKGISDYEKKIKQQTASNVHLMPMTNQVKEFLMASDLLISPFIEPHFARAVVEAAAIGVPAVVSNVGSQNELVVNNETGRIYNTIEEAVRIINELSSNQDLLKYYKANAMTFAEKSFSAVSNAKKTFEAYD